MAKVLLTWELGSGFGHVASLAAIAGVLRERGHHVVAALRNPAAAESFFSPLGVRCVTAPRPVLLPRPEGVPIATYADLLSLVGFDSSESILPVLNGWDRVFEEVDPDVVVFDHSPFALLAAIGSQFGKLQHSTGFCIPPDLSPLPPLRPWLLRTPYEAQEREELLLASINDSLHARRQPALDRLADLYQSADENWLATYEELDHFGHEARQAASANSTEDWGTAKTTQTQTLSATCYQGITPPPATGLRPEWPTGAGPRIFAYLQSDPTTLPLIAALGRLGYPTIARIAGIRPAREFESFKSLKIIGDAIDVTHVAEQCDFAVLSGGHGTLAAVLLAGKPVVVVPIQLEQLLLAKRCEEAGFGIGSPAVDVRYFTNAVAKIVSEPSYQARARAFANRYRTLAPGRQLQSLAERIEDLLPGL